MNLNTEFDLNSIVIIDQLKRQGRIKEISLTKSGLMYRVRYFDMAELHNVWFYEDELSHKGA